MDQMTRGFGDFYPIVSVEQYPFLIGIETWKQLINKIRAPSLKVQKLIETEVIRTECIPDLTER